VPVASCQLPVAINGCGLSLPIAFSSFLPFFFILKIVILHKKNRYFPQKKKRYSPQKKSLFSRNKFQIFQKKKKKKKKKKKNRSCHPRCVAAHAAPLEARRPLGSANSPHSAGAARPVGA
jgi:hypothetical protein